MERLELILWWTNVKGIPQVKWWETVDFWYFLLFVVNKLFVAQPLFCVADQLIPVLRVSSTRVQWSRFRWKPNSFHHFHRCDDSISVRPIPRDWGTNEINNERIEKKNIFNATRCESAKRENTVSEKLRKSFGTSESEHIWSVNFVQITRLYCRTIVSHPCQFTFVLTLSLPTAGWRQVLSLSQNEGMKSWRSLSNVY